MASLILATTCYSGGGRLHAVESASLDEYLLPPPPLPGSLDLFCEKDDEGGPSFFPLCISHGARMLSN